MSERFDQFIRDPPVGPQSNFQIPLGLLSDRVKDRRLILIVIAALGLAGVLLMPAASGNWYLLASLMFVWGGMIAGLYTVGLAHLGSRLSGQELASANAAFIFCYAIGMLVGPQAIGVSMDIAGPHGFAWALAIFFTFYLVVALTRTIFTNKRG